MRRLWLLIPLLLVLAFGVRYCWVSFPIVTGYGAKVLCSALFVSGRNEEKVIAEELGFFPVSLARYEVDYRDSSVTSSVFGLAEKKAIYRRGLGATIINELTEQEIRTQEYKLPAEAAIRSDTLPWPMGDRISDSFPSVVDSEKLAQAVGKLFSRSQEEFVNLTRAVVVLYDGRIIAERYAPGITPKTRLMGWSMTKGITGALAGVLVKQGKMKLDDPAPVAEWQGRDDARRTISIRHLLQQTPGLKFEEVYDRSSHANTMLFESARTALFAASQPLVHTPGKVFHYSSGNSNILSQIYRNILGERDYHSFPYEQLFYPVGMYSAVLEPDPGGTYVGSSFCYATARDWARFGLLYYQGGRFNNVQVLPEDWVQQSVTPSGAALRGEYGFQWWLNRGGKDGSENRVYPLLPADMYYADGYEGQNIFVIPSEKLVVVRLGLTRNREWGESEFINTVIASIKD